MMAVPIQAVERTSWGDERFFRVQCSLPPHSFAHFDRSAEEWHVVQAKN